MTEDIQKSRTEGNMQMAGFLKMHRLKTISMPFMQRRAIAISFS
jgi:hypothetical protein